MATDTGPTQSEDRCFNLLKHVMDLAMKERPPDQTLTKEELAPITKQVRETWMPLCERMTSDSYSCALGATTLVEVDACGK